MRRSAARRRAVVESHPSAAARRRRSAVALRRLDTAHARRRPVRTADTDAVRTADADALRAADMAHSAPVRRARSHRDRAGSAVTDVPRDRSAALSSVRTAAAARAPNRAAGPTARQSRRSASAMPASLDERPAGSEPVAAAAQHGGATSPGSSHRAVHSAAAASVAAHHARVHPAASTTGLARRVSAARRGDDHRHPTRTCAHGIQFSPQRPTLHGAEFMCA